MRKAILMMILLCPLLLFSQNKERKVQYLVDAGLNIGDIRGLNYVFVGLGGAVKAYFPKPKIGYG